MIGRTLGHYRILEKIGEGGMGEVYRAHDEHLGRDVAIKVLPTGTLADEAARKRFRKEALALSKLNDTNIATVHDFDTQDGVDFLVMEYIPGMTLRDKLNSGPLPEKEVQRLGVQLAGGLAAAHEQGVVHRALKPGNLRVTSDGRLKILDFGLAKFVRPVTETATTESLTETHAAAGTLPYMAPEQLRGDEVDGRTDIYTAGVVLYEMATGQRPFREQLAPRLTDAILHQPVVPPRALDSRLSRDLDRIILKALEKEPGRRYQYARELRVDLDRVGTSALVPRHGTEVDREVTAVGVIGGVCVMKSGSLLHPDEVDALEQLLERRIAEGYRLFVLNMRDTPTVNSLSWQAIFGPMARLRMRLGNLVLAAPTPNVRQVLKVTKLDTAIEVYDTVEAAVSSLLGVPIDQLPPLKDVT